MGIRSRLIFSCVVIFLISAVTPFFPVYSQETHLNVGSRLEMFVDYYLIDKLEGTRLKLHTPKLSGVVLTFDNPWEGPFCGGCTVIKDGDIFRMYYRGLPVAGHDGSDYEVTCYAESKNRK